MQHPSLVDVVWDNTEQTILRFDFYAGWTWADANKSKLKSEEMIDRLPHKKPIGVIMAHSSSYLPPNSMSEGVKILLSRHPRIVIMALVTPNLFFRTLANIAVKVVPSLRSNYYPVPSTEAARALVQRELSLRSNAVNARAS
jgi:hypothetical protein